MFAGAAREAVFTKAEVTKRLAAEFVPVALKAALVNGPPDDAEGRLYARIGRSKPAPQGICATDGYGRALVWTLGFDDEASVPKFLDHVLDLHTKHRAERASFATERWTRYPSIRLPDTPADPSEADGPTPPPDSHPSGHACDGVPHVPAGTLIARVVGRALSANGIPVVDTDSQERYVEDSFEIPPVAQAELASAAAGAGAERFRIPDGCSRFWVEHAYLGQLDVKPSRMDRIDLYAKRASDGALRIEGETEASGGDGARPRGDGAVHEHRIRLGWEGFAKLEGKAVTDLVLLAQGTERVRWGNVNLAGRTGEPEVAHLMGGKAFDQDGGVRYGIEAHPAPADRVCRPGEEPATMSGGPPESLRRKMERLQSLLHGLAPEVVQQVAVLLQGLEPLAHAGRFAEVEAVVDRALARAEELTKPGKPDGSPAPGAGPEAGTEAVARRLERLHEAVGRLLAAGKTDEAIALLDAALKSFEGDAKTK